MAELNGDHRIQSELLAGGHECGDCEEPIDPKKPFWARVEYPVVVYLCDDCHEKREDQDRCDPNNCPHFEDMVRDAAELARPEGL